MESDNNFENIDNLALIKRNYNAIAFNLELITKTIKELEDNIKNAQKEGKSDAVMQYNQSLKYYRDELALYSEAESRVRIKYMKSIDEDVQLSALLDSIGLIKTGKDPEIKTTITMN